MHVVRFQTTNRRLPKEGALLPQSTLLDVMSGKVKIVAAGLPIVTPPILEIPMYEKPQIVKHEELSQVTFSAH